MTNIVSLDQVRMESIDNVNDEDGPFLKFLESIKQGKFSPVKAVYYAEDADNFYYGLTRTGKADQIKLLYNLKRVLESIVDNYPDDDEVEAPKEVE